MSSPNIGMQFYKEYFKNITFDNGNANANANNDFNTPINTILESNFFATNFKFNELGNNSFDLKTTYPGLLIGSGYNHEVGDIKEELKLGFFFDYTTGLPLIPGSSVKGLLRSVFPLSSDDDKMEKDIQKEEYIKELLEELKIENYDKIDISNLELEIFEGVKSKEASKNKPKERFFPVSERDIFFDAYPISVSDDGLFSDDYITPHSDPLKNPVPLRFLKVSPGVTFKFNFDLKDGIITKIQKRQLFRKILLDFGIGAKTNVGYGQFDEEESEHQEAQELVRLEREEQAKLKAKEEEKLEQEKQKRLAEFNDQQEEKDKQIKLNRLKKEQAEQAKNEVELQEIDNFRNRLVQEKFESVLREILEQKTDKNPNSFKVINNFEEQILKLTSAEKEACYQLIEDKFLDCGALNKKKFGKLKKSNYKKAKNNAEIIIAELHSLFCD